MQQQQQQQLFYGALIQVNPGEPVPVTIRDILSPNVINISNQVFCTSHSEFNVAPGWFPALSPSHLALCHH